jgi:hypothetical protein
MDDSGSPRTPNSTGLPGFHVQRSEVFRTMTGTHGQHNLGGSATAGIGAHTLDLLLHYF